MRNPRVPVERLRSRPVVVAIGAAVAVLVIIATVVLASGDSDDPVATSPNGACVVELHGKGGDGSPTTLRGDTTVISPTGNAEGWGGRQWLYFPTTSYAAARQVVVDAVDATACTRVVLNGFSNGGAFAAALYCRGETFGDRLVGVMIDDPVTDHSVDQCAPAAGIPVVLYWTGALEGQAIPGWSCASADWTCQGDSTIGIEAYAAALATPVVASPQTDHARHTTAAEPARWLAA